MAIIAGLNMSPVARLKKTWAKMNISQLSILEHQMDPSSNFTSYRSTLKVRVLQQLMVQIYLFISDFSLGTRRQQFGGRLVQQMSVNLMDGLSFPFSPFWSRISIS
jgi:hypothetical protein